MPSVKMRDVKKGEAIRFKNEIWIVVDRHEVVKGNKGTYWQMKLKNLDRGNVFEYKFLPAETLEKVAIHREEYEYLYDEGSSFVFMHPETYDQVNVSKDLIPEPQQGFMVPNIRMNLLRDGEKVVQVELPLTVEIEVTDAPDAARGDTATAVTKLAKLETGGQVRVPGHIKKGDKIKVRVESGEFLGRVN